MTVAEARERGVCRVCGEPIRLGPQPRGWTEDFGAMIWPVGLTLDFGAEFAHTVCLGTPGGATVAGGCNPGQGD